MILLVPAGNSGEQRIELADLPALLGRSQRCAPRLELPGVWEEHCELRVEGKTILIVPLPGARTYLNEELCASPAPLRPGDQLSLGGARFVVEMSPPLRRSPRSAEAAVWLLIVLVTVAQLTLVARFF